MRPLTQKGRARMREGFQRLRLLWMSRCYTAKGGDLFVKPPLHDELFSEVVMRLREISVHLQRLAVIVNCALILLLVIVR